MYKVILLVMLATVLACDKVKVGDCYYIADNNPFITDTIFIKIDEIRGGWVKFHYDGYNCNFKYKKIRHLGMSWDKIKCPCERK